jgi:hypothetical protein
MLIAAFACLALIALTALVRYEVLGVLNARLPGLRIPRRSKLLVVFFSPVAADAFEVLLCTYIAMERFWTQTDLPL